jgi:hypothetical protein
LHTILEVFLEIFLTYEVLFKFIFNITAITFFCGISQPCLLLKYSFDQYPQAQASVKSQKRSYAYCSSAILVYPLPHFLMVLLPWIQNFILSSASYVYRGQTCLLQSLPEKTEAYSFVGGIIQGDSFGYDLTAHLPLSTILFYYLVLL